MRDCITDFSGWWPTVVDSNYSRVLNWRRLVISEQTRHLGDGNTLLCRRVMRFVEIGAVFHGKLFTSGGVMRVDAFTFMQGRMRAGYLGSWNANVWELLVQSEAHVETLSVTPEEGPIDECNRARARAIGNYGWDFIRWSLAGHMLTGRAFLCAQYVLNILAIETHCHDHTPLLL